MCKSYSKSSLPYCRGRRNQLGPNIKNYFDIQNYFIYIMKSDFGQNMLKFLLIKCFAIYFCVILKQMKADKFNTDQKYYDKSLLLKVRTSIRF